MDLPTRIPLNGLEPIGWTGRFFSFYSLSLGATAQGRAPLLSIRSFCRRMQNKLIDGR